jgi:hypothetical protein
MRRAGVVGRETTTVEISVLKDQLLLVVRLEYHRVLVEALDPPR